MSSEPFLMCIVSRECLVTYSYRALLYRPHDTNSKQDQHHAR